jgi:hypothetical protein
MLSAGEDGVIIAAAGRNCVVFSECGEYVSHDGSTEDRSTTNVPSILSVGRR